MDPGSEVVFWFHVAHVRGNLLLPCQFRVGVRTTTRRLQRVRLFLRSFVLYRPWIPGEHRRGIWVVDCVAAHLSGFEEDSRSEVVFRMDDERSTEFRTAWCGAEIPT